MKFFYHHFHNTSTKYRFHRCIGNLFLYNSSGSLNPLEWVAAHSCQEDIRYNHEGYSKALDATSVSWSSSLETQIAKFMGPTWGPSGSCRSQMGPMLTPRTLPSWDILWPLSSIHVRYIPGNMHRVLLCFVSFGLCDNSSWIRVVCSVIIRGYFIDTGAIIW